MLESDWGWVGLEIPKLAWICARAEQGYTGLARLGRYNVQVDEIWRDAKREILIDAHVNVYCGI